MMSDTTVQTCHQRATGSKTKERRVFILIISVYQSTAIARGDGSRQYLENHGKLDELRRFSNQKFGDGRDVHRNLALAEDYSRPTKRGKYQYVSGMMGIAYNPFLDTEAGNASINFEVAKSLKFWTEEIVEIDPTERERPRLGLLLEKMPEFIMCRVRTRRLN